MNDDLNSTIDGLCEKLIEQRDRIEALEAALRELVNAKALSGVRKLVAGWNGENNDEPYKTRHPYALGATLSTCCGAIYEMDEVMMHARAALDKDAKE